ncbi:MAG: four helix bundle protein, partial [Patescibacteria group bacterium]
RMTNDKAQMPNQTPNPNKKIYDLAERTARFGEAVIDFVRTLPKDQINQPLISQIIRSSTSIGANYMEADGADSKKDFLHKIGLCKREAKETQHWLRMIAHANIPFKEKCRELWQEAHELTLIFSKIGTRKPEK